MSLLQVRGLKKAFGGNLAVDGIEFDVQAGEFLALIGPNGAGKTTLNGVLSGLVKARAGHRRALGDGVRRSADLLDLILAHSRLDFGDQWQVAIEARFSAAAR